MRLILSKIGQDNVRINLIKGVCDTCRECRVWDKLGHAVMPSIALPGKCLNDDTARAVLKAKGTELRMRARGQHATTIEARKAFNAIYVTSGRLNSIG
eukprot:7823405-Pyramimonas_sp.AAC.1